MIRYSITFILIVAGCSFAPEANPGIQSAEQAVIRFREIRDGQLQELISEDQFELVATYTSFPFSGSSLAARRMDPRFYLPPYRDHVIMETNVTIVFGSLSAVTARENATWRLSFDSGFKGGLMVYLDGVTGELLYIHLVPEG